VTTLCPRPGRSRRVRLPLQRPIRQFAEGQAIGSAVLQHGSSPGGPLRTGLQLCEKEHVDRGVCDAELLVDLHEAFAHGVYQTDQIGDAVGSVGVEVDKFANLVDYAEIALPSIHCEVWSWFCGWLVVVC
jgi:hypothetical protein